MDGVDWQNTCPDVKSRGHYILETEKWADCKFLVGTEPNQQIISGHKLILAMASPVFERMFYGNLPADKNDPILIPDVNPDAFRALMEYIYSDKINITSFDKACELCYVAKKYILPHVVEECTQFLWSDLSPKNACRAYEFAKLFEEPRLMQRCIQIISTKTREVLADPSFLDIELSTLQIIFDQDQLNIESELDLFSALSRYAHERGYLPKTSVLQISDQESQQELQDSAMEPQICDVGMDKSIVEENKGNNEHHAAGTDDSSSSHKSRSDSLCSQEPDENQLRNEMLIKNAVKKIRFLTLNPQQFAEGPARSNLLTQAEALSILINISSPYINDCPLPEGFCVSRIPRKSASRCNESDEGFCANRMSRNASLRCSESDDVAVAVQASTSYSKHNDKAQYDYGYSFPSLPIVRQECTRNSPDHVNMINHHLPNPNHQNEYVNETMETRKFYCVRTIRQQMDYRNTSVTDCALTFHVDKNILITGVQVPTQVLCGELMNSAGFTERYSEILYAHLLDAQGSRLTYTHCTSRVRYDSLLEISFDKPVFISSNKFYKIGVVFNKVGWYPIYTCSPDVICHNVHFVFNMRSPNESLRDGLIRAIVFTHPYTSSSTSDNNYTTH